MSNLQDQMFAELRDKSIFRQAQEYAHQYLDTVQGRNVFPTEEALANLSAFDEVLPGSPTPANAVLSQLNEVGGPATVATLGGRYFGFVIGSAVPVGIAAKNLATYWDEAPAMYALSPLGSKLETVVERWLAELLGLPEGTAAGFVNGTSTANICGLAAARYRILKNNNWDVNKMGMRNAPQIRIVAGRHVHSTINRALSILGFGVDIVEWVDVDDQGRIIADQIPQLDENTILVLQAGNVNSGSFDDFETICKLAAKANTWVHIDGAFGLWAGAVDMLKHLTSGMHLASSWAADGHKTLNTPYDCGIVFCSDREAITSALHTSGSYLIESAHRDGMFYTPAMSRRARIIELWAILKYLGKSGIDEMIMNMHIRAKQFANEIGSIEGFHVENDIVFNQILVRCDSDELTDSVLARIQDMRECWLGGSTWFGKKVMRVSICSWATTEEDISRSVRSFERCLLNGKT